MGRVAVRILHLTPRSDAGPLELSLAAARARTAERHVRSFRAAGADDVAVVPGPADDTPFGARLRSIVRTVRSAGGLVVLGSGAAPLATVADLRPFVEAATGRLPSVLANNRYSADLVAITCPEALDEIPDLPSDNALPRWLEEVAGYPVADLRGRWRLQYDLDSPLDVVLAGPRRGRDPASSEAVVLDRLRALAAVAGDRRAELVVAGRTSARALAWLERAVPARVRALVEERGLRAASRLALAERAAGGRAAEGWVAPDGRVVTDQLPPRPPRSVLGALLDRDGPETLGARLADLGDAALVDSRVLLAHRLGPDERTWPAPEDRFASDLLLAERIADPWLRALTESARSAPIPVVLGGHSLVGPGVRLAVRAGAAR